MMGCVVIHAALGGHRRTQRVYDRRACGQFPTLPNNVAIPP